MRSPVTVLVVATEVVGEVVVVGMLVVALEVVGLVLVDATEVSGELVVVGILVDDAGGCQGCACRRA